MVQQEGHCPHWLPTHKQVQLFSSGRAIKPEAPRPGIKELLCVYEMKTCSQSRLLENHFTPSSGSTTVHSSAWPHSVCLWTSMHLQNCFKNAFGCATEISSCYLQEVMEIMFEICSGCWGSLVQWQTWTLGPLASPGRGVVLYRPSHKEHLHTGLKSSSGCRLLFCTAALQVSMIIYTDNSDHIQLMGGATSLNLSMEVSAALRYSEEWLNSKTTN